MVGMARNAWRSTLRRTGASRGHRLESTLRVYCDDAKATVRPRALGVHQMCPQREYSCIQSLRPSKCGESMLLQVHCVRCCSLAGAPVVRNQRSVKYGVRSTVPNRTVASEDPASKQEAWRPSERSSLVPALERVFCDLSKQFSPSQAVAPPPLPLHFVVAVRYLSPLSFFCISRQDMYADAESMASNPALEVCSYRIFCGKTAEISVRTLA